VFSHHSRRSDVLDIRGINDDLLSEERAGAAVHNFRETEEGTLRAVHGPVLYQPIQLEGGGTSDNISGTVHGIHHHKLEGGRDILLVHAGGTLYEHRGWATHGSRWASLVSGSGADWTWSLESARARCFLTQFVSTPLGVIVIPQGGGDYARALFYDGSLVGPLGFDAAPAPPQGFGPQSAIYSSTSDTEYDDGANMGGYRTTSDYPADGIATGIAADMRAIPPVFGPHRIGTVTPNATTFGTAGAKTNPNGGELHRGEWRCRSQLVDIWGNRSPLSAASGAVTCAQEENVTVDRRRKTVQQSVDRLKVQVRWDLDTSDVRSPVLGTNLYRTKDLVNSGDASFYQLLDYATAGQLAVVTLPGSTSTVYPDNIPDSWLVRPARELEPVPEFKVATLALGRLWIGNCRGDPGRIMPSLPGVYGTFEAGQRIYPDVRGEVTALHAVPGGLLAFTESSVFLVTNNDFGEGFRVASISTRVGCVSPDTVKTLFDGTVVWLAREGFFAWAAGAEAPVPISADLRRNVRRINPNWALRACAAVDPVRGEYRCSVPVDGSAENNLTFVFNSSGWSTRDDVQVQAVCATNDERQYLLAAGDATMSVLDQHGARANAVVSSVYVLGHDGDGVHRSTAETREAWIETSWLRRTTSQMAVTVPRFLLWLVETGNTRIKFESFRDFRRRATSTLEATSAKAPRNYPDADAPGFWGASIVGGSAPHRKLHSALNPRGKDLVRWETRRPFWQKLDDFIPKASSFRVKLTFTGDAEFVGIQYLEASSAADIGGGALEGGRSGS